MCKSKVFHGATLDFPWSFHAIHGTTSEFRIRMDRCHKGDAQRKTYTECVSFVHKCYNSKRHVFASHCISSITSVLFTHKIYEFSSSDQTWAFSLKHTHWNVSKHESFLVCFLIFNLKLHWKYEGHAGKRVLIALLGKLKICFLSRKTQAKPLTVIGIRIQVWKKRDTRTFLGFFFFL